MSKPIDDRAYIIVSNLAKLRIATDVLRAVFPGDEYGMSLGVHIEVLKLLYEGINRLEKLVDEAEEDD